MTDLMDAIYKREIFYMTNDSGDIWAVRVATEHADPEPFIIGVCGPLHHTEITQQNRDDGNFEWDTDEEQIAWAEANLHRFVRVPDAS